MYRSGEVVFRRLRRKLKLSGDVEMEPKGLVLTFEVEPKKLRARASTSTCDTKKVTEQSTLPSFKNSSDSLNSWNAYLSHSPSTKNVASFPRLPSVTISPQ